MKIIQYKDIPPVRIDNDAARGVAARVVIGKTDGADHFCMRIFEIAPGGYSPRHAHAWEHEILFHSGEGEAYGNGAWQKVTPGAALFVAPDEEHQIRNTGTDVLVFACLIPAGVPEL